MKAYLGIDIGGSKVKSVFVRDSGTRVAIYESFTYRTPKTKSAFLRELGERVNLVMRVENRLAGIGVGVAGIVDAKRGVLVKAPNIPFLDKWNARKFFLKFRVPVAFDNDSRCFVRAEAAYGAGVGYGNVAGLAIGTGIGGGIVLHGRTYRGAHGSAGEFGHMVIDGRKTLEKLGNKSAFERMGDRSKVIGIGVANIVNVFDPDIVILGGGAIAAGGVKLDRVRSTAKKLILSPLAKRTTIVKGKLGEFAQAVGAALLLDSQKHI